MGSESDTRNVDEILTDEATQDEKVKIIPDYLVMRRKLMRMLVLQPKRTQGRTAWLRSV